VETTKTAIPGVLIVQPKVLGDTRGYFVETWAAERYASIGIEGPFVQDNLSRSARHTLRGLHLQHPHGQGKLVSVVEGSVLDVAVDVRVGSPTFGRHVAVPLSADDHRQLWIPAGFAHGFCVTSEHAVFAYKCTDRYYPEHELGVAWNDPDLGIAWPTSEPNLSARDRGHARLRDVPREKLPTY
jgi:dTDP-4-dehydrorhamnose 3,5-epimerase